MKLKLFLTFFVLCAMVIPFAGCASGSVVVANVSNLTSNGDYLDDQYTHTVSVKKVNVLAEFGITQKEWDSQYYGLELYSAFSSGNAYASEGEVRRRANDAIGIVAKSKKAHYSCLFGKNSSSKTSTLSTTRYQDTNLYGSNGRKIGTVSSPTTEYYDVTKHSFECYVVFFDEEDLIPFLRNSFESVNVYENYIFDEKNIDTDAFIFDATAVSGKFKDNIVFKSQTNEKYLQFDLYARKTTEEAWEKIGSAFLKEYDDWQFVDTELPVQKYRYFAVISQNGKKYNYTPIKQSNDLYIVVR